MAAGRGAPLMRYQLVDVVERWEGDGEVRFPAGMCWHCGSAIAYCVQIRHLDTGEQHEIGTTCAERVGLDTDALKRMLATKYANDRAARAAWRRQADVEAAAQAEVAAPRRTAPMAPSPDLLAAVRAMRARPPPRMASHNEPARDIGLPPGFSPDAGAWSALMRW